MPASLCNKKELAEIRKESLDIYNRIHSIAEDSLFVEKVAEHYSEYPVIPNLRCGAWYINPDLSGGKFAYFKSTDGHFNNWSFNLRRPNIHLLPILAEHPGIVVVDSTRAGKRMPDALSKTVPIWCAVVNRAIAKKFPLGISPEWETDLFTPPASVSRQEHHQIEKRIDKWAEGLMKSEYELPLLAKPVRPIWVDPSTTVFPSLSRSQTFTPLICLSASKRIEEGPERRENGFTYIQGSGDDHELWGRGLTPDVFWSSRLTLLAIARSDLEPAIDSLVSSPTLGERGPAEPGQNFSLKPVRSARGRLLSAVISELPDPLPRLSPTTSDGLAHRLAYVLIAPYSPNKLPVEEDGDFACKDILQISLPAAVSAHSNFLLYNILPRAILFVRKHLTAGEDVCVACPTGKDLGPGVIVTALSLFFSDNGDQLCDDDTDYEGPTIDKYMVRTRLQWIISSNPKVNPSRNTLKRVNEFLMSHLHHPHYAPPSSIPQTSS